MIEVNSPFGMINMKNIENKFTLINRREDKINECNEYIEECKKKLNIEVELYIIVTSSLGVPKETSKYLRKLLKGDQKIIRLVTRRCVIAALRESILIYYNFYNNNRKINTKKLKMMKRIPKAHWMKK